MSWAGKRVDMMASRQVVLRAVEMVVRSDESDWWRADCLADDWAVLMVDGWVVAMVDCKVAYLVEMRVDWSARLVPWKVVWSAVSREQSMAAWWGWMME